jgi:hypothetical protein
MRDEVARSQAKRLFLLFAAAYYKTMSRGWESKSVEEQQAQAGAPKPVTADSSVEAAEQKRQRQALELQRERILSERTSSPHRRSALTAALADIEEKLAELGWSIQLYP